MAQDETPVEKGRVLKVMTIGEDGEQIGEWTKQLPEDPFSYTNTGLQEPPYPLEQLVFLAEQHPVHARVLDQKALDVVGTGWEWKFKGDEDEQKDTAQRDKLDQWFRDLSSSNERDSTSHEVLLAAWNDLETVGQGLIELSRDPSGKLRHWFHVPAHTVRFNRDGVRIQQERQGKKRHFKRWVPGDERVVDMLTGMIYENRKSMPKDRKAGNEMLVLRRPTRRSSWYGIPTYMPATGWITLSTAARDDNILFFENRREPRWAIVLENVEDDPELEDQLRNALRTHLKAPHKNLLIPLSGPAKVHFQKLGDNSGDMSWDKLQERADTAILVAHGTPGERIGLVRTGALGGTTVSQSTRVYKEGVVQTSQALLAARINKLVEHEFKGDGTSAAKVNWEWRPAELDLTEEGADQEAAVKLFNGGIIKLDEARERVGEKALGEEDPRGDQFYFELAKGQQLPPGSLPADAGALADAEAQLASRIQALVNGEPGTA